MPFVTQIHRDNPDMSVAGDRCYVWYKKMVEAWNAQPRWTTADNIYTYIVTVPEDNPQQQIAKELAWQVFFQKYVMKYEDLKEKENGTI